MNQIPTDNDNVQIIIKANGINNYNSLKNKHKDNDNVKVKKI